MTVDALRAQHPAVTESKITDSLLFFPFLQRKSHVSGETGVTFNDRTAFLLLIHIQKTHVENIKVLSKLQKM